MTNTAQNTPAENGPVNSNRLSWSTVLLIILTTVILTMGITYWVVRTYIYAKDFKPVVLKPKELASLDKKLKQLGYSVKNDALAKRQDQVGNTTEFDQQGKLVPEKYTEQGANREISLSERELNALLAKNTDLAKKLAIDLSENLISAKFLVPVDQEFPVLGGKTLRLTGGLELAYENNKPVVILRGVSIMGIPIPNSWLGGVKNIDLIKEFGNTEGFWKAFADGIDNIRVEDGQVKIELKK